MAPSHDTKHPSHPLVRGSSSLELVDLPVTVRIVTVDGKRLSRDLYRQLTVEDLIDAESGELLGPPLGYYHIHEKQCPSIWHRHVLWAANDGPHLATIVECDHDPYYQQQKRGSRLRKRKLNDLLALLLAAQKDSTYTLDEDSNPPHKLEIATYILYVTSAVTRLLTRLQLARKQVRDDLEQLRSEYASEALLKGAIEAAEEVLRQADEQGMEIGHTARWFHTSPARYPQQEDDEDDEENDDLYGDGAMLQMYYGRWSPFPEASGDEVILYWREKDRQMWGERKNTSAAAAMEGLLAPHARGLRVVLATLALYQHQEAMEQTAIQLALDLELLSASGEEVGQDGEGGKVTLPEPKEVWHLYIKEKERFEAVTQQWQTSLDAVRSLGQLFLLS